MKKKTHQTYRYLTSARLLHFVSHFRPKYRMTVSDAINIINYCEELKINSTLGPRIQPPDNLDPSLPQALKKQWILPRVVICVDELLRNKVPDNLRKELGLILDNNSHISVVISTLDSFCLLSPQDKGIFKDHGFTLGNLVSTTWSDRYVYWVPLTMLKMKSVIQLFGRERVLGNPALLQLLCAANGHPRTLQQIFNLSSIYDNFSTNLETLVKNMSHDSVPLESHLVYAALRGHSLPLDASFILSDGKSYTLHSLIARGTFINSLENENPHHHKIPLLSPLHIIVYFLIRFYGGETDLKMMKEGTHVHSSLYQLVFQPPPMHGGIGTWFEEFQRHWEEVRRASFSYDGEKVISLANQFYSIAEPSPISVNSHQTSTAPAHLVIGKDTKIKIRCNPFGPVKSIIHIDKIDQLSTVSDPFNSIIHVGGNCPGFDILIPEKNERGESIVILIECKSSSPGANTTLSTDSIRHKYCLCIEQFDHLRCLSFSFSFSFSFLVLTSSKVRFVTKGRGKKAITSRMGIEGLVELSQVYVVVPSLQKIETNAAESIRSTWTSIKTGFFSLDKLHPQRLESFHPLIPVDNKNKNYVPLSSYPNLILLGREHLMKLYSPTLSYSPNFYTSDEIENVIEPSALCVLPASETSQ